MRSGLLLPGLIWLSVIATQDGVAASFDCAKASGWQEQAICADAALSDSDATLGDLYATALKRLTPEGGRLLRESERGWLRYVTAVCGFHPGENFRPSAKDCLATFYRQRIDDLRNGLVTKGPFHFEPVDNYCVADKPDDAGDNVRRLTTQHAAYPRIDQPDTPATTEWNRLAASQSEIASCNDGDTDSDQQFRFGLVNSRLISVDWIGYVYPHGAAHGEPGQSTTTLVLLPQPHSLGPADLFRTDRPWRDVLAARLTAELQKTVPADQFPLYGKFASFASGVVGDPQRWGLDAAGLIFQFNPYEIGPYSSGAPRITIPWNALSDILQTDLLTK